MNTTFIEIGGLAFEVDTAGEPGAPLVLLLHGFPQSAHAWRRQLPELASRGFFAVAPNQRGYSEGARPGGVSAYATELLVEDALAIASHFGCEAFHLVGHDWGGQLAWLLATHHPERVMTLSVLSRPHPQAFLHALQADEAQAARSGHHRAFQSAGAADRLLENDALRLRETLREQGVPEADLAAYLERLSTREAMDAAINWYRAAASMGQVLPPIQRPTLYVWGDADATVGRVAALATREHVAAPYTFLELPGVGHFSTDQAPEAVNRALVGHLTATR